MFNKVMRLWGLREAYVMALAYSAALAMYIYFSVAPVTVGAYVLQGGLYFLVTNVALVIMGFLHAGFLEPYFYTEYLEDNEDPAPYWDSAKEGMRTAGWKVVSLYYMYFVLNFVGSKLGGLVVAVLGDHMAWLGILMNIAINIVACIWLILGATVLVRKQGQPEGRNLFTAFGPTFNLFGHSLFSRLVCLFGFVMAQGGLLFLFFFALATGCHAMTFIMPGWAVLPAGLLLSTPLTAHLWAVGVGLSVRLNVLKMNHDEESGHPVDGDDAQQTTG